MFKTEFVNDCFSLKTHRKHLKYKQMIITYSSLFLAMGYSSECLLKIRTKGKG